MNSKRSHFILLVSRVFIGAIFAKAVFSIFTDSIPIHFATHGAKYLPIPELFVWIGFTFKAVAGICILLGFKTRTAAYVLIAYTLFTAFNFHDFGGTVFMKEISMIGGLLLLSFTGPGRWSLDKI